MNEGLQKIYFVILAIEIAAELSPKGQPLNLNDQDKYVINLSDKDLSLIIQKMEDEGLIRVIREHHWTATVPTFQRSTVGYYEIITHSRFKQYAGEFHKSFEAYHYDEKLLRFVPNTDSSDNSIALNLIRKEGHYWSVSYEGKAISLKNTNGMDYLFYLLSHPQKKIHVHDFIKQSSDNNLKTSIYSKMTNEQLYEAGLERKTGNTSDQVVDLTAQNQYRKRLQELERELEEAARWNDVGTIERIQNEKEALEDQVRLKFREKSPEVEKVRQAVSKAIKRSLKAISEVHNPLYLHLSSSLKLGIYCSYCPQKPTFWE